MKLAYPVDNEQIFLPNNVTQKGIFGDSGDDFNPDVNPDDGDEEYPCPPDCGDGINIRFTPIIHDATFLAHYFDRFIGENNVIDIIDAFFEIIKRYSEERDLRDGPIALQDPCYGVNNFACWYEYNIENNIHEISCKRVANIDAYRVLYFSDEKLVPFIKEVLARHTIYYIDYQKYYMISSAAIYSLYDYIRNNKQRTVITDKFRTSYTLLEKNTIVARRPWSMQENDLDT